MPVLPSSIVDRIEWFEQRAAGWLSNFAAIGITNAQATAVKDATTAARSAYNAAQAARIAAKDATMGQKTAMRTLTDLGSDAIAFIKAFADAQTTPAARDAVFQLASVPPPAAPSPAVAPTAPTMLTGDPNADGSVSVQWKSENPGQTFFTVWRRTGSNTQWVQIGSTATKKWLDLSVPSGTPTVRYFVRAQRFDLASPNSDEAVVNFGYAMAA